MLLNRINFLVRNNCLIKYVPNYPLISQKIIDGEIINSYYEKDLIKEINKSICKKEEFLYIPSNKYIYSNDLNHWIVYDNLIFRPNLNDDNLMEIILHNKIIVDKKNYKNLIKY